MNLEEKIISEITGKFTIEAYQRGYRWEKMKLNIFLKISTKFLMVKSIVSSLLL